MYDEEFERLARSKFRSKFRLGEKEKSYIAEKGMETIRRHAEDFICKRVAPSQIANDGKQTPMRGLRFLSRSTPRPVAAAAAYISGIIWPRGLT